ncbi:hypothetical protein BC826DRAFT_1105005 [Russula brevipes]|nr:hypothetical protein BC826DRAFT_1105005 [Russula brevipes]
MSLISIFSMDRSGVQLPFYINSGHDTTVSSAADDEAEVALPKLQTYPKFGNLKKEHLHRILVWDDRAPNEEPMRYITPSAKWATEALIGRDHFGYIAYDFESGNLVYLKDFWRFDHPESKRKGMFIANCRELVSRTLQRWIALAMFAYTGDRELQVSALEAQRTKTQDYISGLGRRHSWCPGHPNVAPYAHYRLVRRLWNVAELI